MHVGIDLTSFSPGQIGGVETYIRNVLNGFQHNPLLEGQQISLFGYAKALATISNTQGKVSSIALCPESGLGNFAYRGLRWLAWRTLAYNSASWFVQQYNFDVIHEPFSAYTLQTNRPVVLTVHDIQHEYYPTFFSSSELEFRKQWYTRSISGAQKVIAISEFTRRTIIEKYSIQPEDVVVIHYGLDPQFVKQTDQNQLSKIKEKYDLPQNFVFYPANSWPHKNHLGLLHAVRQLKVQGKLTFKLVLSGVVYPEHQNIVEEISKLGLSDNVMHIGYVQHADIPVIYSLALALVFPSFFEGFGAPVMEAMGCGCPVLCSDVTSLPEIAGGAALLVDPNDEERLAMSIEVIANDASVREKLIELGLKRAKEFSWDRVARRTFEVYSEATHL